MPAKYTVNRQLPLEKETPFLKTNPTKGKDLLPQHVLINGYSDSQVGMHCIRDAEKRGDSIKMADEVGELKKLLDDCLEGS
jgi:hypothetical protein